MVTLAKYTDILSPRYDEMPEFSLTKVAKKPEEKLNNEFHLSDDKLKANFASRRRALPSRQMTT